MPIRPENRDRYGPDWSEPLSHFLTPTEIQATDTLRGSLGHDPATSADFWERIVARITEGTVTATHCPHDVDSLDLQIEVKFSREFTMLLGASRPSQVFRWTELADGRTAAVTVLLGLDDDRRVHTWVIPRYAIQNTRTITTVVPSRAVGPSRSAVAGYLCPTSDLLGAILHYDRDHHAATRAADLAALYDRSLLEGS